MRGFDVPPLEAAGDNEQSGLECGLLWRARTMKRIVHAAVLVTLCPLALMMVFTAASPLGAQICTPTSTALVFDGGYSVSMCYRTPDGAVGQAQSGIWSSQESGLLWFFERGNAEVLVKVLDACSVPASQGGTGHLWVFVAPVTTLGFNLQINAPGGQVWEHFNYEGQTASARSDLYAFPCSGLPSVPPRFDLASMNSDPRGITYANGRFFVVDSTLGNESVYAYDAATRSRDPAYDFELALDNASPEGITHWNGRLFVVDGSGKVYAYSVGTGQHQPAYDMYLAPDNSNPAGIAVAAIDGTDYFFVVDWTAEKVCAYDAATGMHDPAYDFELAPDNSWPTGISFADAGGVGVLLVVDWFDKKVYAYDLKRRPSADVDFDAQNTDPHGIVQHGGVLYVVDRADSYVYAYTPYGTAPTQAGALQPVLSAPVSGRAAGVISPPLVAPICTPTNAALVFDGGYSVSMCYRTPDGAVGQAQSGIWSSQESGLLWFFERGNAEVLVKVLDACSVPASQGGTGHRWVFVAPVTTLGFNVQITAPSGQVWTHINNEGQTASTRSDLYAFPCSGRPPASSGFDLASWNSEPRGITYADGRFFVVDGSYESVYVYAATTRSHVYHDDFGLAIGNYNPEGITYWNGHLFVVDSAYGLIFAYSANTGLWQYNIDLAVGNSDPGGIAVAAIDGTDYFFVVDRTAGNEKVYAYDAATGMHDPTYDFDLAPENAHPEGISLADAGGVGVLLVVDSFSTL